MKKLALLLATCAVSFGAAAGADVTIPKGRVICESESAMKTFLFRKKNSNKLRIPDECRQVERKRRGEIKNRYRGYVQVKTLAGNRVYIDKDAVRYN